MSAFSPCLKTAGKVLATFALILSDLERCRNVFITSGTWGQVRERWMVCRQEVQYCRIFYRNNLKSLLVLIVDDTDEVDRLLNEPDRARWTDGLLAIRMLEQLKEHGHNFEGIIIEFSILTNELRKHYKTPFLEGNSAIEAENLVQVSSQQVSSMATTRTKDTNMFHLVFKAYTGERERLIESLKECNEQLKQLLTTSNVMPVSKSNSVDSNLQVEPPYGNEKSHAKSDSEPLSSDEEFNAATLTSLSLPSKIHVASAHGATAHGAMAADGAQLIPELSPTSTQHQQPPPLVSPSYYQRTDGGAGQSRRRTNSFSRRRANSRSRTRVDNQPSDKDSDPEENEESSRSHSRQRARLEVNEHRSVWDRLHFQKIGSWLKKDDSEPPLFVPMLKKGALEESARSHLSGEHVIRNTGLLHRRSGRRAVPGLPRPLTFKRMNSEKRDRLFEVPDELEQRRIVSRELSPTKTTLNDLGHSSNIPAITMTDLHENERQGYSEDEGRSRITKGSASKRGSYTVRGLSYGDARVELAVQEDGKPGHESSPKGRGLGMGNYPWKDGNDRPPQKDAQDNQSTDLAPQTVEIEAVAEQKITSVLTELLPTSPIPDTAVAKAEAGPQDSDNNPVTRVTESSAASKIAGMRHEDVPIVIPAGSSTENTLSHLDYAGSSLYDPLSSNAYDDTSDTATNYSIDPSPAESGNEYIRAFSQQLARDLKPSFGSAELSTVPSSYISEALRMFSWKLHEESRNPFQWEVAVTFHQKRELIVSELIGKVGDKEGLEVNNESVDEDADNEDEVSSRLPHMKDLNEVSDWLSTVEPDWDGLGSRLDPTYENSEDRSAEKLPNLSEYEEFIKSSESYRWLLCKLRQHELLSFGEQNVMDEIGSKLRKELRAQDSLRKMSIRRPLYSVQVNFVLPWGPRKHIEDGMNEDPLSTILDKTLCITGSWCEAQAMTVAEYIRQTWPVTGETVICLFEKLMQLTEDQTYTNYAPSNGGLSLSARLNGLHSCIISVTAGTFYLSELAEQLAWLSTTLLPSSGPNLIVRYPHIDHISVETSTEEHSRTSVAAICKFSYRLGEMPKKNEDGGFCWTSLFGNAVLVGGYPILQRSQSKTGLEVSLSIMAFLIRSYQVLQCEDRVLMKGYSSLLVATIATSAMVLWHLFVSEQQEERISYFDTRLDALDLPEFRSSSLRDLERMRHIVGWCSNVEDLCGQRTMQRVIQGSKLPRTPSSIVVDRLYLEGGMNLIGGVNMRINQTQEPTKLMKGLDYPSLLRWVATRAIVFFDTVERRSWLVDGASALLHLVRNSLRRDQEDDDSPYEWVFDESKLKDKWDGCTSRQAALKTLKNSDNLNLKLYLIEKVERDGQMIEKFSTLRERVLMILHSLEILVDTQTREASKGEMKTLQTVDRRKFITGYDILDVIDPLEPVSTRIARFSTWGDGWMDLLPSVHATTIFGQGFGDLIRPKNTTSTCTQWKNVPKWKDYMSVSVYTLKMLHEKRLQRLESPSKAGELTNNLLWKSACPPFEICPCTSGHSLSEHEHLDPRQFLVSSKQSWKAPLKPKTSTCVDLRTLQDTGAVVFANSGIFNRRINDKPEGKIEETGVILSQMNSSASQSAVSTSATASNSLQATDTTDATTTMDSGLATSLNTSALDASSSIGASDTNITQGNDRGKRKDKGKGKMIRMKNFFK